MKPANPHQTTPGRVPALSRSAKVRLRRDFLAQVDLIVPFQQLFEHLPGTFFFIKNAQSQLMCASRSVQQRLNAPGDLEMVGTTDHDYFPQAIADAFVRDDQQVMRTREPLLNRVEVSYNEQRVFDWIVTNKFPLVARDGRVIGVIGTIQSYDGNRGEFPPFPELGRVVAYIRSHLRERLAVAPLAALAGVSPRQLHRRFQQAFGLSVQEFIMKTRIQAASDALARTDRTLAEIALDSGFCDQSAFTHQFRRKAGLTPRQYRLRFGSKSAAA